MKRQLFILGVMLFITSMLVSGCGAEPTRVAEVSTQPASSLTAENPTAEPPTAEPAPTLKPDAYLGGWQITRVQSGLVAALTEAEAQAMIGQTAWMAADLIGFDNSVCLNPNYSTTEKPLEEVLAEYKTTPENLDLMNQPVLTVHTDCELPALADFVVLDSSTVLMQSDGWFFTLQPKMDGGPDGVTVWPVGERQSTETPKTDMLIIRPVSDNDTVNTVLTSAVQQQVDSFMSDMSTWEVPAELQGPASEFDLTYQVMNNSGGKLSLLFTRFNYYAGSAHPSTEVFVLNYDLKADRLLTLEDLFAPGSDYLTRISDEARRQLSSPDLMIFEGGLDPLAENFNDWNIQGDNLVIHFDQDRIAPHAVGTLKVVIPFSSLADILK